MDFEAYFTDMEETIEDSWLANQMNRAERRRQARNRVPAGIKGLAMRKRQLPQSGKPCAPVSCQDETLAELGRFEEE